MSVVAERETAKIPRDVHPTGAVLGNFAEPMHWAGSLISALHTRTSLDSLCSIMWREEDYQKSVVAVFLWLNIRFTATPDASM
jgi:hypothetical protein